jgi:polyhydroxybutyrate depolymerase
MRYLAIVIVATCPALGAADGITVTPGSTTQGSLIHGGLTRTFRLRVPSTGSATKPLVLCLHGGGSSAAAQESLTRFSVLAENVGCIVAYPDGVFDPSLPPQHRRQNFNDGRIATGNYAYTSGVDDVGFIAALIDAIAATTPVDRLRVSACGLSNGGLMAQRLGLELGHRIGGIGPVAANLADQLAPPFTAFTPVAPVAVLQISGTADTYMPYDGGTVMADGTPVDDLGRVIAAETANALWRAANACGPVATTAGWATTPSADGCTVERRDAGAGRAGTSVSFLRIVGGGHTWAGSTANPEALGPVCYDFQATAELWSFFAAHPKQGPALVREPTAVPLAEAGAVALDVAAVDDGGPAGLTYAWRLDGPGGTGWTASSTTAGTTAVLHETGDWTAAVTVTDAAGNGWTRRASFTLDRAANRPPALPAAPTALPPVVVLP